MTTTTILVESKKVIHAGPTYLSLNGKAIEKVAFSKHGGYINPETKHYIRWLHLLPREYKDKTSSAVGKYYKAVTIDKVWVMRRHVDIIDIDCSNGLELDVVLGAKFAICRSKPTIILHNYCNIKKLDILELLVNIWKLDYELEDNKTFAVFRPIKK